MDIAVCLLYIAHGNVNVLVDGAVLVEQAVGEQPLVCLFHVEDTSWGAMVAALEPGVSESGIITCILQLLHDRPRP